MSFMIYAFPLFYEISITLSLAIFNIFSFLANRQCWLKNALRFIFGSNYNNHLLIIMAKSAEIRQHLRHRYADFLYFLKRYVKLREIYDMWEFRNNKD